MEEIKRVNEDPDFHVYMSAEEDNRKIENSIREEMIEKGLKEGLERGLKQGLEQGQQREKEKIVLSMLNEGLEVSLIARCTKLDVSEVEKMKKTIQEGL